MGLKGIERENLNWINLAEARDQWWALGTHRYTMNLWLHKRRRNSSVYPIYTYVFYFF
jgi:hypothetical protein